MCGNHIRHALDVSYAVGFNFVSLFKLTLKSYRAYCSKKYIVNINCNDINVIETIILLIGTSNIFSCFIFKEI